MQETKFKAKEGTIEVTCRLRLTDGAYIVECERTAEWVTEHPFITQDKFESESAADRAYQVMVSAFKNDERYTKV